MLQIKNFIIPALVQSTDDMQGEIVVSYSKLAEILNEAEGRSNESKMELMRPGAIRQTREQTPPEELESEDEKCYQQAESKQEKRAEAEDADWEP